jgi:aspartate/methionine/tyrosine aminotransferase
MHAYKDLNREQLINRRNILIKEYENYRSKGLKLDMSRGKPCPQQLDLSNQMFEYKSDFYSKDGTDCRNYGILDGIIEAKTLFSEIFDISIDEIFVGGNSSLNLMYDLISKAFTHGLNGFEKPWGKLERIKFLCPCPGYDRHFAITEHFGVEMINIPMKQDGPDMDMIESLAEADDAIKGIWCVPKYSNPTGVTYSDEVVKRLSSMKTKADDFIIIWDNAYAIHNLYDKEDELLNIIDECRKAGNPNRAYMFASTAKITFAGSGVAIMASSSQNISYMKKLISYQTICYDKINMLRHVKFLKNAQNVKEHMKKHAEILRPKFEMVNEVLSKNLSGKGIASWNKPKGGYFISLNVMEGCAKRVVALAKEAGVTLTPAGSTYPYKRDPYDMNIRIAPSYPPIEELRTAMEIVSVCIELAALEKILNIEYKL